MVKPAKPPRRAGVSGVLVLDKPSGPTSFDVVAQVRRRYGVRSVGHAGTLDPLASGVLVVMLGEATKLSEYLTAANKHYRAELTFGRSTDTLDVEGRTIDQRLVAPGEVSRERLLHALELERERQLQVPPAFSAIKQDGETAYKKARRGETFALPARPVHVESLELVELTDSSAVLDVRVSKGYYVRSLARDVCEALGVPGCLSALRRLASGEFRLDAAVAWPPVDGGPLPDLLNLAEAAQLGLAKGVLTPEGETRARQGKRLTEGDFSEVPRLSPSAWLSGTSRLVAVGERIQPEPLNVLSAVPDSAPHFRVLRGFPEHAL